MSQSSSPVRPPDPSRETPPANAPRPGQAAPDQAWKLIALAVALVVLALLLFFLFAGTTTDQSAAPNDEPAMVEEEEVEEEAAAPAPPPSGGGGEEARPSSRGSGGGGGGGDSAPQQDAQLPPLQVLSVGYSAMPAQRVVALRIGGALPYFLHEGDSIGDLKVLSIMSDRVQVSHKGKKYEIRVGKDGSVKLPAGVR